MDNHITGNIGEWSEIYALFKLLGDGKIHAGDEDMNLTDIYYPILAVLRQEQNNFYQYLLRIPQKDLYLNNTHHYNPDD